MKRGITIIIIIALLGISFWAYRSYRASADAENASRLAESEQADAARRTADEKKKALAEAESHRLAALLAEQKAVDENAQLSRLRAEEAAAEARRLAAERDAKTATDTREALTNEKTQLSGEALRLAEEREVAAAAAEATRLKALKELEDAYMQKKAEADRLDALQAATLVQAQKEKVLETKARRVAELLNRSIYPSDYKRREHYYLDVNRKNAEEEANANAPTPASAKK